MKEQKKKERKKGTKKERKKDRKQESAIITKTRTLKKCFNNAKEQSIINNNDDSRWFLPFFAIRVILWVPEINSRKF